MEWYENGIGVWSMFRMSSGSTLVTFSFMNAMQFGRLVFVFVKAFRQCGLLNDEKAPSISWNGRWPSSLLPSTYPWTQEAIDLLPVEPFWCWLGCQAVKSWKQNETSHP
jgi:hypothetical protein